MKKKIEGELKRDPNLIYQLITIPMPEEDYQAEIAFETGGGRYIAVDIVFLDRIEWGAGESYKYLGWEVDEATVEHVIYKVMRRILHNRKEYGYPSTMSPEDIEKNETYRLKNGCTCHYCTGKNETT